MKKNDQGITLIALVVTIIVLLILVAISIATLIGDNGILTRSDTAREENRGGSVQEARDLWKIDKATDQYDGKQTAQTLEELLNDLENQKLITKEVRLR